MDQWLLLQQKDGSLYLVMGYRSGGLPYSGAHPYRWIVRLNGGATELTRADLNGDGIIEPWEWMKACPCFDAIDEYQSL